MYVEFQLWFWAVGLITYYYDYCGYDYYYSYTITNISIHTINTVIVKVLLVLL